MSFASISGKQVEAAFDGGLPLAQAGITRRRIWSNSVMPKVKKYRHGTPCWIDLATADLAGARAFYAGSFSWEYVDEEMGEMDIGVYSMAKLEASAAAAIYESGPGQIRSDEAATWNVYVSVDDVDAVVERVAANGGAVLAGSRDVDRAGRLAVIADPTG